MATPQGTVGHRKLCVTRPVSSASRLWVAYPGPPVRRNPSTMPNGPLGHRLRTSSCRATGIRDRMDTRCWIPSTRSFDGDALRDCEGSRVVAPHPLPSALCPTRERGSEGARELVEYAAQALAPRGRGVGEAGFCSFVIYSAATRSRPARAAITSATVIRSAYFWRRTGWHRGARSRGRQHNR